ncbi:MAG: anti-sigma F factor antagonist [Halanaerobiales bacterium]
MDIALETKKNILIVKISGEMDISTVPDFKEKVKIRTENNRIKHLVLDLSKVKFIDSSGLGAILGRYRFLDKKGGKVLLVNPGQQIKKIFDMSGILKIMDVYSSIDEALSELEEGRIA